MIRILHGEDSKSSYERLNLLIVSLPKSRKINLSAKENSKDNFINALSSQNLFKEKELIIGHNLIKSKIAVAVDLKSLSSDMEIIFWEDTELTNIQLSKFKSIANIELFKLPTNLYLFLDSIMPGSKQVFVNLQKLKNENSDSLCWQLSNRLFLLILSKNGADYQKAQEISGKISKFRLLDWQWQKINNQAYYFEAETLKSIFVGLQKIDYMKKSGATNLDEMTLINILLIKYLKPQINATITTAAHGRHSLV